MHLTNEMAPAFGGFENLTHDVEFCRPDSVSVVALVKVAISAVRASTPSTGFLSAACQTQLLQVSMMHCAEGGKSLSRGACAQHTHVPQGQDTGAGPICLPGMPVDIAAPMGAWAPTAGLGAIAGAPTRRLLPGCSAPATAMGCLATLLWEISLHVHC